MASLTTGEPFYRRGHGDREVVGYGYLKTLTRWGPLLLSPVPSLSPVSQSVDLTPKVSSALYFPLHPHPTHCLLVWQVPVSPFLSSCRREGVDRRPRGSREALLTFSQRVQAVEHELVDGAADGAVVQRGRAAPSGQHCWEHCRELSRGEPHRPQWAPAQGRLGAARGPH